MIQLTNYTLKLSKQTVKYEHYIYNQTTLEKKIGSTDLLPDEFNSNSICIFLYYLCFEQELFCLSQVPGWKRSKLLRFSK